MKKNLIIVSVLSSFLLLGAAQAQAIDKSTEDKLVGICKALQSNSKAKLHRVIKQSNLSYKKISEGLVCNGMDPVTFALRSNAHKTAQLFAHKSKQDYHAILAKL
jgi:hypothetical protein